MIVKKRNSSGFTLIELSVVLAIISMIIGGVLTLSQNALEAQRIDKTRKYMEYVIEAIDQYVDENGFLPCPADPTDLFTDNTFGFGYNNGVNNCTAANLVTSTTTTSDVIGGAIPVNTLNIPPRYVMDGWNRRITYVVDEEVAIAIANYSNNANTGDISISSGMKSITTAAAVLLISHGSNGYGAWPGRGGAQIDATGGGADEDENANTGTNALYVQSLSGPNFDDILIYRFKWQLDGEE